MTRSAIGKNLIPLVAPFWDRIKRAAAKSLKKSPTDFLPDLSRGSALGCGVWGCAWITSDPRFVVKVSLDATEGPHIAIAMREFQKHPGIVYYHRIWRSPDFVWTPSFGYTPIWIMVREEVDVDSTYKGRKPAPKLRTVANVLDKLPDCCDCLSESISIQWQARGTKDHSCASADRKDDEVELRKLLAKLKNTDGVYVGDLITDAYFKHRVLLGDVHYDNVGYRRHDLSAFGVKKHKKLVVTDLGDHAQPPLTTDRHPGVTPLKNPLVDPRMYQEVANSIPVLPR